MSGSCLPDMRARLQAAGILTPIALGRMPAVGPGWPETVLALLERPGGEDRDRDARAQPALERLRLQLIARAPATTGLSAAEAIAWPAYYALLGRHFTVTIGGNTRRYDWLVAMHTPAHTGYDANDRPLVSVNFMLQRHGVLVAPTP